MPEAHTLPPLVAANGGLRRWLSNLLYQRRNLMLLLMLTPPLLWFGVVYMGSLLTLLAQSLLTFDEMSMSVLIEPTLQNFQSLAVPANLDIVLRTLGVDWTWASSVAVVLGFIVRAGAIRWKWHMPAFEPPKTKG